MYSTVICSLHQFKLNCCSVSLVFFILIIQMAELMGWHPSGVTLIQEPEFELLE